MLNINVTTNIDISTVQYPIYFEKRNECVHCGAKGQLIFVDKFGKETNKEIYPFDHIKCKACGRRFSILWNRDDSNGKMIPCAVDPSFKQEFLNIFNRKYIRKEGIKEI